ncbi:MAG: ADP-forming succinate--CoA ligase subunit beta [Halobacteria archaeon]|nr:ADP-forming succinate--CoA ligase subunit beta [Halobacteria archaeon]
MRLHEYQAKQIFKEAGITIPEGEVASTPQEVRDIAEDMGGNVVVKAQVHVGGRGKAGGIKVVDSADEAQKAAEEIIGMDLKGRRVEKVLVEEAIDIENELYAGVTMDRGEGKGVAMVSSRGGVNIEEVAEEHPEAIARTHVDPAYDLQPFEAREAVYGAGIPDEVVRGVSSILSTLYTLWDEKDAEDAEINPLVINKDGDLIAADAVLNIDNSALYRQKELAGLEEESFENEFEAMASEKGFDYVRLDGNVGIIGNGAGLVMTTLDLVDHFGGRPANFLDIGGGADAERVSSALELVFEDKNVDAVVFNIFGGITRCDEVAKGINEALPEEIPKPLVVRLTGTNEKEGRELLTDRVETAEGLEEAVKRAIELTGGA